MQSPKVTLFGAAGEVTGSCTLVESEFSRVLVDFGMFQGAPEQELRNADPPPIDFAKLDAVVLTHAHVDHIGDAPAIAKLNNTVLYGPADMVTPLITLGVLPANLGHRFNKTGHVRPLPGIKVTAVAAEHSSLLVWNNPASGKLESHPAGEAVGYIIELENGFKIWHMGDTGLFGDMKFISERYKPDLVLMPIGGNFTMDPEDAAWGARNWINPKMVIPIHYNSNPLAKGTLAEFQEAMKGSPIKVVPMSEGQTLEF